MERITTANLANFIKEKYNMDDSDSIFIDTTKNEIILKPSLTLKESLESVLSKVTGIKLTDAQKLAIQEILENYTSYNDIVATSEYQIIIFLYKELDENYIKMLVWDIIDCTWDETFKPLNCELFK